MTLPKLTRPTWRSNPFSEGGKVIHGVHHAGGVLLPEPDVLYNVSLDAPDIVGLPWTRRSYDAWTTPAFREAVRAWLITTLAANLWIASWALREKATSPRMSMIALKEPLLIVTVTRGVDKRVFQTSTTWNASTRDDLLLAAPKLDGMRVALETENTLYPP